MRYLPPFPDAKTVHDILVVCTGNLCRSPMVAAQLRAATHDAEVRGVRIHSAGTIAIDGQPASVEAIEVASEHDLDITYHRSSALTGDLVRQADLILVMEERHLNLITNKIPFAVKKTFLLSDFLDDKEKGFDVTDPLGTTVTFYEQVFNKTQKMIDKVVDYLKAGQNE